MKSNLAILFILVATLSSTLAAYVLVPPEDYIKHPLIQVTQDYGLNIVRQNALDSGKLPDLPLTLVTTNSIYTQTESKYLYYKFDLTFTNSHGDTFNTKFTV